MPLCDLKLSHNWLYVFDDREFNGFCQLLHPWLNVALKIVLKLLRRRRKMNGRLTCESEVSRTILFRNGLPLATRSDRRNRNSVIRLSCYRLANSSNKICVLCHMQVNRTDIFLCLPTAARKMFLHSIRKIIFFSLVLKTIWNIILTRQNKKNKKTRRKSSKTVIL